MRDQYFASGTYGRLRMGMALRGPCFTSAERNAEDYAFARDLGLPISVHVGMAGTADASRPCSATACSEPTSTTCTATCSPIGSSTSSPKPRVR
jgi:hypothetical protein